MKKISIIAVLVMVVMLVSACGAKEPVSSYENSLEVINTVWDSFAEADKFPVGGGDSENLNMEGPGKFNHENKEELNVTLALPEAQAANIDDAASMMHMMNANQFTAGAYRLTEGTKIDDFAKAVEDNLGARQWICGSPEKYLIISTGNYVISAFGNAQNIDNFKKVATEKLENAKVVLEGNIEG